ncbi:hypothetical protein LCGC14_1927140, partial [marine sediment metagenome]
GIEAKRAGDIAGFLDAATGGPAIGEYLGAILVVILSVFIFTTFALVLWLLVTGGTVGAIAHAAKDKTARFSMGVFWQEAKGLFMPLAWYYTILSVAALALFALLAGAFAVGTIGYGAMGLGDSRLGVFFSVMGVLLLGSCGFIFFLCVYVLSVQGLCPLAVEKRGAMASIKRAWGFLEADRKALWLILITVGGYVVIQISIALFGGLLQFIPLLGAIVYVPYSIVANIFGIYLYIALLGAVVSHYVDSTGITNSDSTASGSSAPTDISALQDGRQVPPPFHPDRSVPHQY